MKQLKYIATAVMALAMVACGNNFKPADVKLESEIDSLNYAFGVSNGMQIKQYYLQNDTTGKLLEQILKGLKDGLNEKVDTSYATEYALGQQIGGALKMQAKQGLMGDSTITFDYDLIVAGLKDGMAGKEDILNKDEATEYLNSIMSAKQEAKRKAAEEKLKAENADYVAAQEKWLADNGKKEGVITTESGLQYQVITEGTGAKPTATDIVKVNYEGRLTNDTIFDSSYQRGEPAQFPLGQVIPGWTEGIQLMTVGSKYKFFIPADLAYGGQQAGKIPPFSTLVFTVELLEIVPQEQPEAPAAAPAE